MANKRDYYEVLGLQRDAGQDEVRKAYRGMARKWHPDVSKEDGAAERFKEINEAYEVLSDPQARAKYDRFGHSMFREAASDFSFSDPFDIFEAFFGGFARAGAQRRAPRRGDDLRMNLTISFEESISGVDREVEYPRVEACGHCGGSGAEPGTTPLRCPECNGTGQVRMVQQSIFGSMVNVMACPRCQGEGEVASSPCTECRGAKYVEKARKLTVKIPAGVSDGLQIRLSGEGSAGQFGGPAGNLYVALKVKPHPVFKRQDDDILLDVRINFAQAALGADIKVPTVDGEEEISIPAGIQSGQIYRLRGKGAPHLRRNGRGDELITLQVTTPSRLTSEQKGLLQKLAKTLEPESVVKRSDRGFFEKVKDAIEETLGNS